MKFIHLVVMVAFFTASFDTFLVLNVGGTIRVEQIMMVLVILAGVGQMVQQQRILWPRAGMALVWFCLVNFVLIFQWTGLVLTFNIQLLILLLFFVVGIFATAAAVRPFSQNHVADARLPVFLCFRGLLRPLSILFARIAPRRSADVAVDQAWPHPAHQRLQL